MEETKTVVPPVGDVEKQSKKKSWGRKKEGP